MKDEDFEKLVTSVKQMRSMMHGEDVPHKRTSYPPTDVKVLRKCLNLTQEKFAAMIGVSVRTLQNWEQGHRQPEGPAKALLRVVELRPEAVLAALHS